MTFDRSPEQIAIAVEMLLNHNELTLQDSEVVAAALDLYTFDRNLAKLADVERL